MQGSKIVPGRIYAINYPAHESGLARFHVTAVVQRRTRNTGSPHDYQTDVEGYVVEEQKPDVPINEITRSAKSLLGPYEEQAELKARADAEKAEHERAKKEREDNKAAVVTWLYKLTGLTPHHADEARYERFGVPFNDRFTSIEINDKGINALLRVINGEKS